MGHAGGGNEWLCDRRRGQGIDARAQAAARGCGLGGVARGQHPHAVNYANIPNATYCHRGVPSIGMTEAQVKEKIDYKVGKFPFMASGRARTAGETDGHLKIIREAKSVRSSARIVGLHAGAHS
jgi:dihydrolipoyl dehydrogenase